jgi:hypothetical protein
MRVLIVVISCLSLLLPQVVWGDMSSANYQIYSDTVGVNGGDVAIGGIYTLTDTIGESSGIGVVSSTTYNVSGGYQAATRGTLSFNLSTTTVNLGTLSKSAIASVSIISTISCTDAGYNLIITNVSGIMPQLVADGVVTTGVEEYGISVSGPSQAFVDDQAIVNNLTLVSTSTPVDNDQETLTFKASIGNSSVAGTYNQNINIMASAAF